MLGVFFLCLIILQQDGWTLEIGPVDPISFEANTGNNSNSKIKDGGPRTMRNLESLRFNMTEPDYGGENTSATFSFLETMKANDTRIGTQAEVPTAADGPVLGDIIGPNHIPESHGAGFNGDSGLETRKAALWRSPEVAVGGGDEPIGRQAPAESMYTDDTLPLYRPILEPLARALQPHADHDSLNVKSGHSVNASAVAEMKIQAAARFRQMNATVPSSLLRKARPGMKRPKHLSKTEVRATAQNLGTQWWNPIHKTWGVQLPPPDASPKITIPRNRYIRHSWEYINRTTTTTRPEVLQSQEMLVIT